MKKNRFLAFVTSALMLNGCVNSNAKDCIKIPMQKQDKEWFSFYKKYNNLCFRSNLENVDTMVVRSQPTAKYTICNKFELSEYQYEEIAVLLKPSHCHGLDKFQCDIVLKFSKHLQKNTETECLKNFYFFDMQASLLSNLKPYSDTIRLTGIKKPIKCYRFNYSKPKVEDSDEGKKHFTEFIWGKEFGLVQYTLATGEIFELVKWY